MNFDSDFLKLFEQLNKLTEENDNIQTTSSTEKSVLKYIDLIYSIKDRDDFIEKAQELYDNLPVNMGYRVLCPGDVKSKRFRKQADGSVELTSSRQTEIINSTEAVATLQAIASIPNTKIYTFARYPYSDKAYYKRGEMGTRIINSDGSFNYPVHNYIVPQLIQRT